jgi:beta-glucanase (GH16 family)
MPAGGRWTFDHPNHLLLNLAVGGEWPGSPTSATPFPSTMLVVWVRVYAPQS